MMNKIDAQSWKADMPDFREKTKAFYNGEMSKGDYKGYSGRYGSYAQKDGKASMLRLRMPAGRVTKEKLAFIAEAIRKYNVKKAHFTTGCWNCNYGWRWRFSTKCDVFSVVRCGSG